MNIKKYKKVFLKLIFLFIGLAILFSFANTAYATVDPNFFKPTNPNMPANLKTKTETVLGMVQFAGTIISVIVLVVIGIKFVIGSAEEKADYKKALLPYLIGAIFLFASSNLVSFIYDFAKKIN